MDEMKVLITGGNGFIGSHLADRLEKSYDVSLFDVTFGRNTQQLGCRKIKGDICNYSMVSKIVQSMNIIVHLAAVSRVEWGQQYPNKCLKVNAFGTLNLLEAIRKKNPNVVMILGSSREVYGEPVFLPVTEDHPKVPISVYGVSKLTAENLVLAYHRIHKLNYAVLRISNVYGSPRDLPQRVIPKFMTLALKNKPIPVYGGQQILDFTFIDDVITGVENTVKNSISEDGVVLNNDFNFTSGKGTSIIELAKLIKGICNSNSEIIIKRRRNFDVSRFIGSYQKAKRYLVYVPKYFLQNGLRICKERMIADV